MKLKYIVVDVDGTMTDGGVYYDNFGNELKKFCTKDAAGFFAAAQVGIKTLVLTGRDCPATVLRMKELKADFVFQNVKNKLEFLLNFMKENNIVKEELGYIGDDLNDLPPMSLAGYIGCPADACKEVKEIANYISTQHGGNGAVRDVIEHYLRKNGAWWDAVANVYGIGI